MSIFAVCYCKAWL